METPSAPAASAREDQPAPVAAITRAEELVRGFPQCFWFRDPGARVRTVGDVELVVDRLRRHGDRHAWSAAADLRRCL